MHTGSRHRRGTPWTGGLPAPFVGCHAVPLAALITGVTVEAVAIGAALYVVRMFCITAGYHRYFAHGSYCLGRLAQLLLAIPRRGRSTRRSGRPPAVPRIIVSARAGPP